MLCACDCFVCDQSTCGYILERHLHLYEKLCEQYEKPCEQEFNGIHVQRASYAVILLVYLLHAVSAHQVQHNRKRETGSSDWISNLGLQ